LPTDVDVDEAALESLPEPRRHPIDDVDHVVGQRAVGIDRNNGQAATGLATTSEKGVGQIGGRSTPVDGGGPYSGRIADGCAPRRDAPPA
jgi:hypothetical protein